MRRTGVPGQRFQGASPAKLKPPPSSLAETMASQRATASSPANLPTPDRSTAPKPTPERNTLRPPMVERRNR